MNQRSIKVRLLAWQLASLFVLSLSSCFVVGWLANQLSYQIYDEHLLNSADSIFGRIQEDTDEINVNLPQASRHVLRHQDKDNFYYQILSSESRLIESDEAIPMPRVRARIGKPIYYTGTIDGAPVRILEIRVPHPKDPKQFLYIETAETLNTRQAFSRMILATLVSMQLLFIAFSALAIWIGIGKGLSPLQRLKLNLDQRTAADLKPLPLDDAPLEVLSLVQTINRLLLQISEHIQTQSRFAANVAHQLRTPLSGIKTYVGLALRYAVDPKVKEVLEQIDYGICRLTSLIEKMLLLAKCDPALIASEAIVPVDLNSIILDTTAELCPYAEGKQINVDYSGSSDQVKLYGDPVRLHELVKNIIENAITYSPLGSKVKVYLEVNGKMSLIVEDNGPGVPLAERERVFEPFYRLSSNNAEGTGLGLSIAKEIATAHQASISIEDNPQAPGTRVIVNFPPAKSETEADPTYKT